MKWCGLLLPVLAACTGGNLSPGDGTDPGSPTDTFPSFYGEPPKNLLVISIDTLRRDSLPRFGGNPTDLSFLDAVAAEGVVLEQHVSCSNWTYASVLCAQSGADNTDVDFVPRLQSDMKAPLIDGIGTLGEWLGDAGFYSTLASGNSWFSSEWEMDRGFSWSIPSSTGNATRLLDHALEPLLVARTVGGQADRWYMHIHLVEPHAPYDPPEEYLGGLVGLAPVPGVDLSVKDEHYDYKGLWDTLDPDEQELLSKHLRIRYDAELAYMDDQLAAMWVRLGELGMLDDTLVVVWTDHGEQFWEHGEQTHAYGLNLEENDGIALFWANNIVPAVWSEPTSHIDIAPTILSIFGLPIPDQVTGKPIGTADPDRPLFALSVGKWGVISGVRHQGMKLTYRWSNADKEFYRLASDPYERDNLYDDDDPDVIALWDLLMERVDRADALIPDHTPLSPGP